MVGACNFASHASSVLLMLLTLAITDAFLPPSAMPQLRGSSHRRAVSISMAGGFGKPAPGGGKKAPKKKGKAAAASSPTLNDVKGLSAPPKNVASSPDQPEINVKAVIDSIDDSQDV
eukprot:1581549-Rhodomonas_salina.1